MRFPLALFALLSFLVLPAVAQETDRAQQLAREVWKASGGDNWSKVKTIRFTFVVEQDGKQLSNASHVWDVAAGTDEVEWKGRKVKVNLNSPGEDEGSKAAYARWVNDSYWLLAPLKVLDPGVKLAHEGLKPLNDVPHEGLRLTFESVGLTPSDQYLLYIDPASKLVRAWDYIPHNEPAMHGTWENYQEFGGLKLATDHAFAGKHIRFTGIEVETK